MANRTSEEKLYTWDEWKVEQASLKKEMHRKSQFKIRRVGANFLRPTGGEPYVFTTQAEARDAISLCNDGPIISGEWEIVEVTT